MRKLGVDVTKTYTAAQYKAGEVPGVVGGLFEDRDGKIYKLVLYDTGAGSVAAVAGQVAYYNGAGQVKNFKVTSDLSDSVELGAGVLQSAPADGEYCWVQVRGPATLSIAPTAGTDGDPLTPTGSTDGTLDLATAITDHICAYADDISAKEILCMFPL